MAGFKVEPGQVKPPGREKEKEILMGKKLIAACMVVWVLAGVCMATVRCEAAEEPPPEGGVLPDIRLSVPQEPEARQYLGVPGNGTFTIPQIKAEVVLIEIFSMYCPYCQQEAPRVNELYQRIAERKDLKDRIKIIGIGAGNTPYEVKVFQSHYDIPFPLFSDANLFLHNALGRVRTPYFIGVRINADGSQRVIYSQLGRFEEVGDFLDLLVARAKLK